MRRRAPNKRLTGSGPVMAQLIEFDTARIRLRQWRESDLAPFAALNADPQVMEFFPRTLEPRASNEMAHKFHSLIARRGWGFWAVEIKGGAPFIGFVGLHVPVAALPLPFSPCVEVGWRLSAVHWGQGYASEAAQGALRIAFERLMLPELVSFAAAGNLRSRRVMERIGMRYIEHFEHPGVAADSPLRPHVLYRRRREP
jgi:RimJ/RimL family protein N-acetyltransferase